MRLMQHTGGFSNLAVDLNWSLSLNFEVSEWLSTS